VDGDVTEKDMVVAKTLELKLGMQVMTLVNNSSEGYQNGSIGTIVSVNGNNVEVRLQNGRLVTVTPYTWEVYGYEVVEKKLVKVVLGSVTQIPLRVAYAITIHKSQGQTYERANISPDCFSSGQLYVALSRVKSAEGMSLSQRITPFDLKTSAEVQAFYAEQELRA